MTVLIPIVVMALVALGAFVAMGDGMILSALRRGVAKLPEVARKPLTACAYCMVSVWGTSAVLVLGICPVWYHLPVYWLCAVGLQRIMER
jgi:F0F1-type ATP synthase membrane subunit c/vacuolar-type H+-ATPase subunit K